MRENPQEEHRKTRLPKETRLILQELKGRSATDVGAIWHRFPVKRLES